MNQNENIPALALNPWMSWAAFFFLLAALMGLTMRYYFAYEPLDFLEYKNLKHAHSHVAMMGWGFMGLVVLLIHLLYRDKNLKLVRRALVVNVAAVLGLAISFSLYGYHWASIALSTVHLFCTYVVTYQFLKNVKATSLAVQLAHWALIWLLVSSIGLWAIAPVGQVLGKLHPLYFMTIQFFLHFQFNGWFVYGVLALLVSLLPADVKLKPWILPGMHLSILFTYALSVSWSTPTSALFYANSAGVVVQAVAFGAFLWVLRMPLQDYYRVSHGFSSTLIKIVVACLVVKIVVQSAVVLPFVAVISYTIRLYVIGFIHLILLGMVTFIIGGITLQKSYIGYKGLNIFGWSIIVIFFMATEVLLFLQGTMIWLEAGFLPHYHQLIFWSSALFPVGIAMILISFMQKPNTAILQADIINSNKNQL